MREWLSASGSLPTIQARLRADLYAAIQVKLFLETDFNLDDQLMLQEQASDPTLRLKPKEGKASIDVPTRFTSRFSKMIH